MAPWFVPIKFRFAPALIAYLKQIPGTSWNAKTKCWIVPIEIFDEVVNLGAKLGVEVNIAEGQDEQGTVSIPAKNSRTHIRKSPKQIGGEL